MSNELTFLMIACGGLGHAPATDGGRLLMNSFH